jgi:hypothetical protein
MNMKVSLTIMFVLIGRPVLKDRKRIYAICDLYKRYIRSIYDVWKIEVREVWIRKKKKVVPPTLPSNFFLYSSYILT